MYCYNYSNCNTQACCPLCGLNKLDDNKKLKGEQGSKKAKDEKVWKQGKKSNSMELSQRWSSRIIKVRDGAQESLKNKTFAIPILNASD